MAAPVSFSKTLTALSIRSFPALGLVTISLNSIVSVISSSPCVPLTFLIQSQII